MDILKIYLCKKKGLETFMINMWYIKKNTKHKYLKNKGIITMMEFMSGVMDLFGMLVNFEILTKIDLIIRFSLE